MKTLHYEHLAAVHFAKYFSFAVIMSEINPTDHKTITARHFTLVEADFTLVEADFSLWRDYGLSKGHYQVHHVWCLDQEKYEGLL